MNKNQIFSWHISILLVLLLAMISVVLDKPTGSIEGQVTLEQKGFGLYSDDLRGNKVYVLAVGRGPESSNRGVWVQTNGHFRIDQLPVGEYSLTCKAPGYTTTYQNGVFTEDGKVTRLKQQIALAVEQPSVNIASNCRVFTTNEPPHFWINTSGATVARVKIYRKDLLSLNSLHKTDETNASDNNDNSNKTKDAITVGTELNLYRSDNSLKTLQAAFKDLTPIQEFNRTLNLDADDAAHAEFKLSQPLAQGDYFAIAEVKNATGDNDWNVAWFSVSNLGLIVKQAPDQTLVRAIDLITLKPRVGVDVVVMQRGQKPLGKMKTNADGFAKFTMPISPPDNQALNLLCIATQGLDRAYNGLSFYTNSSDRYKTYFYTERPVYRLGQTVYFKGISRIVDNNGFHNLQPGTNLSIVIEDPDNQKLYDGQVKTSAHGTFNGLYQIPSEGKTGAYQITIKYPDGVTDYERFEVAQYRKPEYQVEVIPLTPRVVAGSKMKARVRATYFFGGPVANARVKYSVYKTPDWSERWKLMSRPEYYSFFDDWSDEDSGYGSNYAGDYLTEGYAQTDASGEALVEFNTADVTPSAPGPYSYDYLDQRYKIEAEVTDISRMAVIGSGNCEVTAGDFALFVTPQSSIVKSGEPLKTDVTAIDYDGHPVANQKVTVSLVRWVWDQATDKYRSEETTAKTVATTDGAGKATVQLPTGSALPTDTYYITAVSTDKTNHKVQDQSNIWIANANSPYVLSSSSAEQESLALKLDKQVYKAGETARVMVTAPVTGNEGAQAIIAVESTTIYQYRVIDLKSTAQLVEIPLKAEWTPNVYITATFVSKKHQFYTQDKMVKISPDSHFLKLAVKTDKAKYKPGENVTYTISAREADGKPANNIELSLGVVDESIYSIRPETAGNIQKFFYSQKANWVVTTCSFPEQYSGGPDKIEPRVRKDFRDTAAWLPTLITNAQGIATATIKLPDNLTTWRATVRGISTGCDTGSAIDKVISTQDLILRLALPRFFSEGDRGIISAIVHNYTEQTQTVDLSLNLTNQFKIADHQQLQQKLTIESDKASRYDLPITVVGSGEATVSAKAIGQTAGDALERKIPVRALGLNGFFANNGLITNNIDQASLSIKIEPGSSPLGAQCQLSFAASSIGPVLGNFNTLIDYPYGCTEQTMSRLMPSIVAMRLRKELMVPLSDKNKQKFQKVYTDSMKKLTDYQHSDGGWGWWQDDASNAYLTAHVMEGLWWLQDSGYKVDPQITNKGKAWLVKAVPQLQKQLADPHITGDINGDSTNANQAYVIADRQIDLAKMLYALSFYGAKCPAPVRSWLPSQIKQLTPEALSYATMTFFNNNDEPFAKQFYSRLTELSNKMSNKTDSYINWDYTPELWKKLHHTSDNYVYTYKMTGIESTALALQAALRMEPNNTARIEAIKKWILMQRNQNGWENTKTTAAVFVALLEEEIYHRASTATNYSVTADLFSKSPAGQTQSLLSQIFNATNIYSPETIVTVPVKASPQQLQIKKNGPGRLYYNSMLTYIRHLKPGETVVEKSLPEGIHLKREFFRLEPTAVTSDGQIHFRSQPINGQAKAGETLLMKVSIDTPTALPYVILEAALPSGGEVVADDPKQNNLASNDASSTSFFDGDWGTWWWTHQDILDDRIVFFVTDLKAGKSEFHTMIRMEMPGIFQLNPVSMQGMYTKYVRAYSPLNEIKITE